ncbi:MAG: DMT family transporter [Alphaproteobacteria bacterium]|nr:DMT family transporter [Alphaproteobacteria bacterium]
MKLVLLLVLGLSWAMRIAAFKIAAERGVPAGIIIQFAVIGILMSLLLISLIRRRMPPRTSLAMRFYVVSGCLGFLLPFALETIVAGKIPAFVFIVIISTMPVMTLLLSFILRVERASRMKAIAVLLGFGSALLIAWDNTVIGVETVSLTWILLAFLVPLFYTLNTVFVASRWPSGVDAVEVATGQAAVVGTAALLAMPFSGLFVDGWVLQRAIAPVVAIVVLETAALLIYLRIVKAYGAIYVSLANYVSMFFGVLIGFFVFFEQPGWVTLLASLMLIYSLHLIRKDGRAEAATDDPFEDDDQPLTKGSISR